MPMILVVDDYSVTIRVLSTQLRKGGYEVISATNGHDALCALEQQQVNLAIVDIAMPVL